MRGLGRYSRALLWAIWACVAVFAASVAYATTPVTDLVSERAEIEFGAEMPPGGFFQVNLAEGNVTAGAFIQDFWIDKRSGQFIANVITERGDIHRVWGLSVLTVDVPVPVRRLMPDELVTDRDVQMVSLPWARLNDYAVTQYEDVVGMQVVRVLNPGRPVLSGSISPPIIISRGERVSLQLVHGAMQLEAKGKALTDAYVGQEVRVMNIASNKTVTGIAMADGIVEVRY